MLLNICLAKSYLHGYVSGVNEMLKGFECHGISRQLKALSLHQFVTPVNASGRNSACLLQNMSHLFKAGWEEITHTVVRYGLHHFPSHARQ